MGVVYVMGWFNMDYTYITRNNNDCHRYVHNLELYNNKPSIASCTLYNELRNIKKQAGNNSQFQNELKYVLIKGCYYSTEEYLNEEICNIGY
jgi:hypothetical protein